MHLETISPAPIDRPALSRWLHDRGLRNSDAAAVCGVGREQVRRYCLPFGDPARVVPPQDVIERIVQWTKGDITAADFYPAHLRPGSAELEARP